MTKANFGYHGDDLTIYQLSWESANEAAAAGNLLAAVPSAPIYPSLWRPRYLLCRAVISGTPTYARCICERSNPAFVTGPGSTVTISGTTYSVMECVGELRQDV